MIFETKSFLFGKNENFTKLQYQYQRIVLNFNVDKTVAIAFNLKGNSDVQLELYEKSIPFFSILIYLGMPLEEVLMKLLSL